MKKVISAVCGREDPQNRLEVGKEYKVVDEDPGAFNDEYLLEDPPFWFNSIYFSSFKCER